MRIHLKSIGNSTKMRHEGDKEQHIIGICGGIGSGKSVVSRLLRLRGEAVYDCDMEARRLMDSSAEVLQELNIRYGDKVCPPQGPINRAELAQRIFSNDTERQWLNCLVHRMVREDVSTWAESLFATGSKRCFVESAIPATSGLTAMCSRIIIVDAPESLRIARVKDRDGLDESSIHQRILSQQEEDRQTRESGCPVFTINNDNATSVLANIDLI